MFDRFGVASLARLPHEHLAALAPLRVLPGMQIWIDGTQLWLRWDTLHEAVLGVVLPLPGATLFEERDGQWFLVDAHLPAFDVPTHADFRPLHDVIFPAPVLPVAPPDGAVPPWQVQPLRLVSDPLPRPATALIASLASLAAWVDSVPTPRLQHLRFALCDHAALLIGRRLPLLPVGMRFWGTRVFRPLGFRTDPDLPESALLSALHAEHEDLALMMEDRVELISDSLLRPLTRAVVRLTKQETPT